MEDLIDKYILAAEKHGAATEEGDHKLANKMVKELTKYLKSLEQVNRIGDLSPLLKHENEHVRLWASYDLLEYNMFIPEVITTLQELASRKGVVSLGAEMTLKRWRGEIK